MKRPKSLSEIVYSENKDGVVTFYIGNETYHSRSIHNPQAICDILNKARQELTIYEAGYLSELLHYLHGFL